MSHQACVLYIQVVNAAGTRFTQVHVNTVIISMFTESVLQGIDANSVQINTR